MRGRRGLSPGCRFSAVLMGLHRRPVRCLGVRRTATFLEAVCALELPRGVQDHFDPVCALIVDAAAADRLRELVQHSPRHAGQVAQVAMLAFLHYRHLAAYYRAVCERSAVVA